MAGVRGKKATKLMRKASKTSPRTRKGRNKVEKISRTDKPKGAKKRSTPGIDKKAEALNRRTGLKDTPRRASRR